MKFLEFECNGNRFAVPVACVQRVVLSAWPTPLPGAPDVVLGVLNIAGQVVTVLDFFCRVGLVFSGIETSQRILVLTIGGLDIGIVVDAACGVIDQEIHSADSHAFHTTSRAHFVSDVIQLVGRLCIIIDPESLLFDDEASDLRDALKDFYASC